MNYAKVMEALGACEGLVLAEVDTVDVREHLLDMIRRAREMGPERKEKLMRWLGFIQGVLWTWGVPLDDLKAMNRSNDKEASEDLFIETMAYVEEQLLDRLSRCKASSAPSTAELEQLVDLADKVDEARQRRARHEEMLAGARGLGEALTPVLVELAKRHVEAAAGSKPEPT